MQRYRENTVPKKSLGQQVKEDLIFMVVGTAILWLLGQLIKFVFYPLRWVFMSDKALEAESHKHDSEKIHNREVRREQFKSDPQDPLNQYLLRFVKKEGNDSEDNSYQKWYLSWTEGKVLDTNLRWAPEVYKDNEISPEFLRYLKIQKNLHLEESGSCRRRFLRTLKKYYPEVPATFENLDVAIQEDLEEATHRNLKKELSREIQKTGVPEKAADKLSERNDLSAEELRKRAEVIKRCTELGYSEMVAEIVSEYHVDPDSLQAQLINSLCLEFFPKEVVIATAIKRLINDKDLIELVTERNLFLKIWGERSFQIPGTVPGMSLYEEMIIEKLANIVEAKEVSKHKVQAAWEE